MTGFIILLVISNVLCIAMILRAQSEARKAKALSTVTENRLRMEVSRLVSLHLPQESIRYLPREEALSLHAPFSSVDDAGLDYSGFYLFGPTEEELRVLARAEKVLGRNLCEKVRGNPNVLWVHQDYVTAARSTTGVR